MGQIQEDQRNLLLSRVTAAGSSSVQEGDQEKYVCVLSWKMLPNLWSAAQDGGTLQILSSLATCKK